MGDLSHAGAREKNCRAGAVAPGAAPLALLSPRLTVAPDLDPVIARGGRRRHIAGVDVALNELQPPPGRRTVAAAAAGFHADQVAGCELVGILLVDAPGCSPSSLAHPQP